MTTLFEKVIGNLIDGLDSLITSNSTVHVCDLHCELFNQDDTYIYYLDARKDLVETDVFACIGIIQAYENNNFGELHTPLANPCRVANMMVYILGYELLQAIFNNTPFFTDRWDDELTATDLQAMLDLANAWLDDNPSGLQDIFDGLESTF